MAFELPSLKLAQDITRGLRPSARYGQLLDSPVGRGTGSDRYLPKYVLVVNGTTLDSGITDFISSITFEDNDDLFNEMKVELSGKVFDPKTGKDTPIPNWVQASTIFSEGNIMWVYMGYGFNLRLVGGAEIVKREFKYGEQPGCTVTGYDPLHRMGAEQNEEAKTYKGLRASEIAKSVARKSAYSGTIGALFSTDLIKTLPIFTPRAEVQKLNESDYTFLKRMADVRGWRLYSTFDATAKKFQLYFGPDSDKQDAVFRYEYNRIDLLPEDKVLDFDPEITVIDQHAEIKIVTIDETRKKKVSHSVTYNTINVGGTSDRKLQGQQTDFQPGELKNGFRYRFKAFGFNRKIHTNRPFKDEQEAKKYVIQWARHNVKNFITGKGKIVGNESVQARQMLLCMGLGETFSGTESTPAKWYLNKVKHSFKRNAGQLVFETTFDCRKVIDFLPDDELSLNLPSLPKVGSAGAVYVPVLNSF